jgi:tetratricopeptide (TPR) repeat protein
MRLGPWLVAIAASASLSPPLGADVITLLNGNQIHGEIIRRGERSVTVKFPGGVIEIQERDIASIEGESRAAYLLAEGEKHLRRQDFDGAIRYFESALEEKPDSAGAQERLLKARQLRADDLSRRGLIEEARDAYQGLLRSRPGDEAARLRVEELSAEIRAAAEEEALGKEEIESGRIEAGYARLKKLYDRYLGRRESITPALARALVALGNHEIQRRQFKSAEAYYLEALALDPDLVPEVEPGYVYVKSQELRQPFQQGEHAVLLKESDKALEVVPASPVLQYLRGHALEGLGRPKEAAEVYRRIVGEKASPGDVKNLDVLKRLAENVLLSLDSKQPAAEPRNNVEVLPGRWRVIETEHFTVHHRNHAVGSEVARVAEATYQRLHTLLGLKTHWYRRCEIYIFPRKAEFDAISGRHAWMGGRHRIVSSGGALAEHRIDTYQTQPRLAQTVIPHEIGHAMLAHRLLYRGSLPLWLNEGFAIWVEPEFVHQYYGRLVRHAVESGSALSVNDVVRAAEYPVEDRVKLFYAQSYSIAKALIDAGGLEKFLSFAAELALSNESLGALLKRHYNLNGIPGLDGFWRGSISQ